MDFVPDEGSLAAHIHILSKKHGYSEGFCQELGSRLVVRFQVELSQKTLWNYWHLFATGFHPARATMTSNVKLRKVGVLDYDTQIKGKGTPRYCFYPLMLLYCTAHI